MTNFNVRDLDQLFDRLGRFAIGFEPLFHQFKQAETGYPPINILNIDSNETTKTGVLIELAVAGFKRDELEIEEKDGTLIIRGQKSTCYDAASMVYHGIAGRSFTRQFKIAENLEITEAKLEDGILSITLYEIDKIDAKPNLIPIK